MKILDQYFSAFAAGDIDTISALLCDDVVLQDPNVGRIEGKEDVLPEYAKIFSDFPTRECRVRRCYELGTQDFACEFSLALTNAEGVVTIVEGVDCITIRGHQISSIRAYLDVNPRTLT